MTSATTPVEPKAIVPSAPVEAPAEANLTHVVLRCFHGGGLTREAGEVVDGSAWRSVERLCEMRYLRPLLAGDPTPVTDGDRFFIDENSLLAYIDSMPATETEED